MGTTVTPNLSLIKPDGSEPAPNWPAQVGSNMDTIDSEINTLQDKRPGERVTTGPTSVDTTPFNAGAGVTIVATLVTAVVEGQRYEVQASPGIASTSHDTLVLCRIKEDDESGTTLDAKYSRIPGGGNSSRGFPFPLWGTFDATVTGAKTFVIVAEITTAVGAESIHLEDNAGERTKFFINFLGPTP